MFNSDYLKDIFNWISFQAFVQVSLLYMCRKLKEIENTQALVNAVAIITKQSSQNKTTEG